jgi:hypothetical protein
MGLGTSMFLVAVGAILKWGVTAPSENFDINMIGLILMIVGIVGAALSLAFWNSWGGFGRRSTTVTEDSSGQREVIREQERY